jgi:hypothetical protein
MQSSVDRAYLDQVQRVTLIGLPTVASEIAVEARLNALAVSFNQQGSVSPRADEYNLFCGAEYADHAACRMLIAVRDRERMCSRW